MNPDDVLTEWERLAQEATAGRDAAYGQVAVDQPPYLVVGGGSETDAAFIAAARTAWPAATAALRAVLDLHRRNPTNGISWCRRCGEAWPCLTVQAVNDAIGGQG